MTWRPSGLRAGSWEFDPSSLEFAEADGLVRLEGGATVRFRHPLVRGTSYHGAEPGLRRRVHRGLAKVTDGDRRAWHLASGATGPDAGVADALDEAARMASGLRAYAAAALAYARAAELSEGREAAATRLYAAGASAFAAGNLQLALGYLEGSAARSGDKASRARAHHLWGTVAFWGSSGLGPAVEHLTTAATLATGLDPREAASAYADLSLAQTVAGDCRAGLEAAEKAAAMIDDQASPPTRALVGGVLSWALALRGQTRRARAVLADVEPLLPLVNPLSPEALSILLALNCRLPFGDLDGALTQARGMVDAAREAGALGALPFPLSVLIDLLYRVGDWDTASAALDEAVALAEETGQDHSAGLSLALRARVHAARGLEIEARADLGRCSKSVQESGRLAGRTYVEAAAGFLELGLGRIDAALIHLREAESMLTRLGWTSHR